MSKKTIGQLSSELKQHESQNTHSAHEQMQEMLTDYDRNLWDTIDEAKKKHVGDFFVVVVTKKERLMNNVVRNYFFARSTCPTPEWDQTVYHYHFKDDYPEFLWVVPSQEACIHIIENALNLPPEERLLRDFVLSFNDGSLLRRAQQINNEKFSNIILTVN